MSTSDVLIKMFRDIAAEMPPVAWLIFVFGMVVTASLYWLQRTASAESALKMNIGLPILGLIIWWVKGTLPLIGFGVVVVLWKISNTKQSSSGSIEKGRESQPGTNVSFEKKGGEE
jgi:hypothetical protein